MGDDQKPPSVSDALKYMKKNAKDMIEYNCIVATITRSKFLALKDAGFTDEQALAIVRTNQI